jgi:wyosine [tRNA(Phe)-imidazoG37] synthetase (radical SAM superfamily)
MPSPSVTAGLERVSTAPKPTRRQGSAQRRAAACEPPIVFGPVRSRRLGWSLGINNIRPKTCTYSCVYCQVGATTRAHVQREMWHSPSAIADAVSERAIQCRHEGQRIDYATFVPDGEPTLDAGLGDSIEAVHALGLPVAVISNGSLLWCEDVRSDLLSADWVSVKVDTVDELIWRRLNRPVSGLDLAAVLEGIRRFIVEFTGHVVTETMLVEGLNDDVESVARMARLVRSLGPDHAYVTVPTRPGTESWVQRPSRDVALRAAESIASRGTPTSLLYSDTAGCAFAAAPDAIEGLLGILAVHPMTEKAARDYLDRSDADWSDIQGSIDAGRIVRIERDGTGYLRVDHGHGEPQQKR